MVACSWSGRSWPPGIGAITDPLRKGTRNKTVIGRPLLSHLPLPSSGTSPLRPRPAPSNLGERLQYRRTDLGGPPHRDRVISPSTIRCAASSAQSSSSTTQARADSHGAGAGWSSSAGACSSRSCSSEGLAPAASAHAEHARGRGNRECPWLTVRNRRRRAGNGTQMARQVRTAAAPAPALPGRRSEHDLQPAERVAGFGGARHPGAVLGQQPPAGTGQPACRAR